MSMATSVHAVHAVDDIEDIYVDASDTRANRGALASSEPVSREPVCQPDAEARATVPGVQSVWVKTFGCSHNQSDSEYMMGVLQAYGYRCDPRCSTLQATQHSHWPLLRWAFLLAGSYSKTLRARRLMCGW